MFRRVFLVLVIASLVSSIPSCSRLDPLEETTWEAIGTWPSGLRKCLAVENGRWSWRWMGDGESGGTAQLIVADRSYHWRLDREPPPGTVRLVPVGSRWLSVAASDATSLATTPPLPRLKCDSEAYSDLVALLRALITPRFAGRVVHWPERPVPVRAPAASSGGLDLAACLREAVSIWNQDSPIFVWDDSATWGVRLAHYAGSTRSPTMQFQITRVDQAGRPLTARIAVGDDYDSDERRYAVRAMSHELAHAALLWGHSPDREHLLWGAAPPLRADPSDDERRAADLLHALPEGLDLNRYGRTNDPAR